MHKMIHFFKIGVFMIKYKPDVFQTTGLYSTIYSNYTPPALNK